jgi:DNA repair exonuclease SbcCD nuclease subunit
LLIGSSGDWHLDCGLDADITISVRQIIQHFAVRKVNLIALPGDLFDRKSTPEGRNLLRALVHDMAEVAPVVICYGNHDEPGDLDIFGEIKSKYPIKVFSSPHIFYPGLFGPDCVLHILPWFTKSSWISAHPGMSKEDGDKAVSKLAMDYLLQSIYLAKLKPGAEESDKHILVSHLVIDGATLENHQPFKGEGVKFGQYDLMEAGFFAGIFGHIHLRQQFPDLCGPYFYNGSPAALDYGEHPEKYCSVLDTDAGTIEWIKLDVVDRYSMEYVWKKGEFIETGIYEPARIKGARVRVLLKVDEGDDIGFAKAELERVLMELGALEAKVEPQVQPKEAVRAADIAKADTLEQKLEAYWKATNNYPSEEDQAGMKEKLRQLEDQWRSKL